MTVRSIVTVEVKWYNFQMARFPTLFLCLLAFAVAARPCGAQSQRARSDQEILIQLERDWDEAFHHKDIAFIENLLADEFVATYDDGSRGDRARELVLAAAFDQQIDSSTLDDFIVKSYGDTAVVWFTQHLVGPSLGRTLTLTFRYVDVFVLRAGRWQCVATQSTKVTGK
jgi:ketosteroid isomerase-like protein